MSITAKMGRNAVQAHEILSLEVENIELQGAGDF